MKAFPTAADLIRADNLQGPCDLYSVLLTIKNGFADGGKLGSYPITKAQAAKAKIEWAFVQLCCETLGLKLENRHGKHGHLISR